MPFKRIPGTNKYKSPSGRTWTKKQVNLYEATNGFEEEDMKKRGKKKEKTLVTLEDKLYAR